MCATEPALSPEELEKGPAFQSIVNRQSEIDNRQPSIDSLQDWPTYRHDAARSGVAPRIHIAPNLKQQWEASIGGTLSAVTVAGGNVFVAEVDAHRVHALDAASGKEIWSFTAGGRVDSPPTITNGMAIFGSRDGSVYCLRGRRCAGVAIPSGGAAMQIVSFGQLESVTPIHGSVLAMKGSVYFAAGESSYLDNGIIIYQLDAAKGTKTRETQIACAAGHSFQQRKRHFHAQHDCGR